MLLNYCEVCNSNSKDDLPGGFQTERGSARISINVLTLSLVPPLVLASKRSNFSLFLPYLLNLVLGDNFIKVLMFDLFYLCKYVSFILLFNLIRKFVHRLQAKSPSFSDAAPWLPSHPTGTQHSRNDNYR